MSNVENPPAFPSHAGDPEMSDPRNRISCGGMTLRDWFAGQALCAGIQWCEYHETGDYAAAAVVAYEIADAMLTARGQQ